MEKNIKVLIKRWGIEESLEKAHEKPKDQAKEIQKFLREKSKFLSFPQYRSRQKERRFFDRTD